MALDDQEEMTEDEYESLFQRAPYLNFIQQMGVAWLSIAPFWLFFMVRNLTLDMHGWERWPLRLIPVLIVWWFFLKIIKPFRQLKRFWLEQDEKATAARRVERELQRVRNERAIQEERWKATEAAIKADKAEKIARARAIEVLQQIEDDET